MRKILYLLGSFTFFTSAIFLFSLDFDSIIKNKPEKKHIQALILDDSIVLPANVKINAENIDYYIKDMYNELVDVTLFIEPIDNKWWIEITSESEYFGWIVLEVINSAQFNLS